MSEQIHLGFFFSPAYRMPSNCFDRECAAEGLDLCESPTLTKREEWFL